jgi:hypothetical protein
MNHDHVRAAKAFRIAADNLMAAPRQLVFGRLWNIRFKANFCRFDMI